jgi:hypothetical protein
MGLTIRGTCYTRGEDFVEYLDSGPPANRAGHAGEQPVPLIVALTFSDDAPLPALRGFT